MAFDRAYIEKRAQELVNNFQLSGVEIALEDAMKSVEVFYNGPGFEDFKKTLLEMKHDGADEFALMRDFAKRLAGTSEM